MRNSQRTEAEIIRVIVDNLEIMKTRQTALSPLSCFLIIFAIATSANFSRARAETLTLHTRSREETAKGNGDWEPMASTVQWDADKTAIIICDMWNQHWCKGATARVAEMAPRMNEVLKAARSRGVLIIHCPSDTMKYYENFPQRKVAEAAPKVPLIRFPLTDRPPEAPLPIDDSDGGCDDEPQCKQGGPWTHEVDTLQIQDGDAITDSEQAFYLMKERGIKNVIVMGVHGNMCVLGRPFAIRQMVSLGQNVVLMRDMIDTMYNSRKAPYVNHFVGTDLIVEHIEKYLCPSITSADFLGGEPFHFKADKRPHIVFVIGENEYHTWETLPEFARNELDWRGYNCSFVTASTDTKDNVFTNYEAIKDADLLVLSVRRRTPPSEMMALIRAHLEAGKPLIGIRTACHAFGAEPPDAQHEGWSTFDTDVLGCHYENHYGNNGPNGAPTLVKTIPGDRPILTGIPASEFEMQGSLYKSRNPARSVIPLMTGRLAAGSEIEPVAWINTAHDRRVFYTSMGTPENFKQPAFRELLLNAVSWTLDRPVPPTLLEKPDRTSTAAPAKPTTSATPQKTQDEPMTPAQSQAAFKIADDLEIDQVLTEPQVRQPVFMNFDERGRLWVVEYLQYPYPAGLKMLSHDSVWRAVYDKVPPPPPHQFVGADKICIFEDTHGNGVFDKEKVFADGLNIVTAVTKGRGGVWVLNPPYLLFYPDANNDDIPDGDPQVVLSGFGLEDTHSVANSLRWGPDGWLYACQGSTVSGNMIRPGIDNEAISKTEGQLIWRYHPETKRFEVFAEGGGNAFGCEIDAQGRIFSGHNGGDTRGFHYMQGAYLQKGFEKHGPLSNPYAFGYFPPMPHPAVERFTHNFIIYDGGALPESYNGKLFGIEPLQGRVVESDIEPDGSTFQTRDLGYPVTTSDQWFKPVDIKVGPDGAIYIADWYDGQVNHYLNSQGHIDKSNGRIYRLKAKGAKPIKPFDLAKLSTPELVDLLAHTNKWFRQEALRLIGDRKDSSVIPRLRQQVENNSGQLALESLWALNLSGGLDEERALKTLDHSDPFVRLWTVRLLCDSQKVSAAVAQKLVALANDEPNVEVRAQLACSAKRLPTANALPIVRRLLAHNEDMTDKRIPLLLWWALESKCERDRDAIVSFLNDPTVWREPLVQSNILNRVMRRYAAAGTREDLLICAKLLRLSPGPEQTTRLMAGFEEAFKGRSLATLPNELLEAMAQSGYHSLALGIRRGDTNAMAEAIRQIRDPSVDMETRREYLEIFGEVKEASILPVLLDLTAEAGNTALHKPALAALQQFEDPSIGTKVVARLNIFDEQTRPAALELLSSRPAWAQSLLDAADVGKIGKNSVPQDVVRKIKTYKEKAIVQLGEKTLGR